MEIKILSLNQKIYEGKESSITFPGKKGEFQVLDNHAPLFALLKKGKIRVGRNKEFSILSGIVRVFENKVVVLVRKTDRGFYKA